MSNDLWPELEIKEPTNSNPSPSRGLKKFQKREDKTSKPSYSLIPKEALTRMAQQFQYGVDKYGERDGWKSEVKERPDRYKESLLRHALQYVNGETDEDHLSAVCVNAAILLWWEANCG